MQMQFKISDQLIEKRFEMKRIRNKDWKLPKFAEVTFIKKLVRYHEVRGRIDNHIQINKVTSHPRKCIWETLNFSIDCQKREDF